MSLHDFKENECLLKAARHCACVEFVVSHANAETPHRFGFQVSQLLHYQLTANDDSKDSPPEKLTIAFATADVTLTGWRLGKLADMLRDGELLATRSLPSRYAHLDETKCFIAAIAVEPIPKG